MKKIILLTFSLVLLLSFPFSPKAEYIVDVVSPGGLTYHSATFQKNDAVNEVCGGVYDINFAATLSSTTTAEITLQSYTVTASSIIGIVLGGPTYLFNLDGSFSDSDLGLFNVSMASGTPYSSTWNVTVPWGTENLTHIDQYTYPGGTISDESPCVDNSGIVFSLAGTLASSELKENYENMENKGLIELDTLELNKLKGVKINDQEVRKDGSTRQNFSLEGNMVEFITTKSEMRVKDALFYDKSQNIKFTTNQVGDTIFIYERKIEGNYYYLISSGDINFNKKLLELLY